MVAEAPPFDFLRDVIVSRRRGFLDNVKDSSFKRLPSRPESYESPSKSSDLRLTAIIIVCLQPAIANC